MTRRRPLLSRDPLRHVTDAEVERAIRTVPTHYSGWSAVQWAGAGFANSSSARSLAYGSNVTTGNFLIVAVAMWESSASILTVTVTDTLGNSYSQAGSTISVHDFTGSGYGSIQVWYAPCPSGGANTVTVTPSATTYMGLAVHEYTPPAGTVVVDQSVNATGHNIAPTTGTCPVAAAGELIFAAFAQGDGTASSYSVASPFTMRVSQLNGSTAEGIGTADDTNADSAGDTATFTMSLTAYWAALAVSFMIGSAASPRCPQILVSLPPLPQPYLD